MFFYNVVAVGVIFLLSFRRIISTLNILTKKQKPQKFNLRFLCFYQKSFIPKGDFFVLKGCFHIDEALVGGAAEAQGNIFERFDVSAVNQNVDERKHFVGGITSRVASLSPKLLI